MWATKGGFRTKTDAINYLPKLRQRTRLEHKPQLLCEVYDRWVESHTDRVKPGTMAGYSSAWKHFEPLHRIRVDQIAASDLQKCVDDCPAGKRTKQMMSVIAGLVFKYAIKDNQILRDPSEGLYTGKDKTTHYQPLTEGELATVRASGLPYSDYVVALCYLGFRPNELLELRKDDYHKDGDIEYLIQGSKTDAGTDRIVTVPPVIHSIISLRMAADSDLLFPRISSKGNPIKMSPEYFRESVFKPMMEKLGIRDRVPYSARHTYSNKIKGISAPDRDKADLMGHTDYNLTKKVYQTSTIQDRAAITDQLK